MMERWCGREIGGAEGTGRGYTGMEDEWMDGVRREQPGGRCDLVTERGRNAWRRDIFNPWCFGN